MYLINTYPESFRNKLIHYKSYYFMNNYYCPEPLECLYLLGMMFQQQLMLIPVQLLFRSCTVTVPEGDLKVTDEGCF